MHIEPSPRPAHAQPTRGLFCKTRFETEWRILSPFHGQPTVNLSQYLTTRGLCVDWVQYAPGLKLTMDYRWVLYADHHAIFQFFTPSKSFEILSVKTTKKAILTYFRVPLDIKQQYLQSKYFVGVIENSFLFNFLITTCF